MLYMATATSSRQKKGATILSVSQYMKRKRLLPESWYRGAGMAKHHKKALEAHLRKVKKEWD